MNLGRYRKFIVAIVGALGIIAAQVPAGAPSWLPQAIGVATALGVYLLRNDPATATQLGPTLPNQPFKNHD